MHIYVHVHVHIVVYIIFMYMYICNDCIIIIIIKSFFFLFRYVTFNICSPELASTAVRILCLASHSVAVAKDILNSVTSSQVITYLFY